MHCFKPFQFHALFYPSYYSSHRIEKVTFQKADSLKGKNFFITEDGGYYKPIVRNPILVKIAERNRQIPKEVRVQQSKLLSKFYEANRNKAYNHISEASED
jgi:hypothetical protein